MEKLVRDRIIEFSRVAGDGRVFRYATPEQLPALYAQKIVEESQEVCQELVNPTVNLNALMEELSDLMEIIEQTMNHFAIGVDALAMLKKDKAERKGAFADGLVLDLQTNIPRKS